MEREPSSLRNNFLKRAGYAIAGLGIAIMGVTGLDLYPIVKIKQGGWEKAVDAQFPPVSAGQLQEAQKTLSSFERDFVRETFQLKVTQLAEQGHLGNPDEIITAFDTVERNQARRKLALQLESSTGFILGLPDDERGLPLIKMYAGLLTFAVGGLLIGRKTE